MPAQDPVAAAAQRSLIANTLAQYAWAYDWDDMPLLSECFSAGAEVLFNTGLRKGRADVMDEMNRRRSVYRPAGDTPWHVSTNIFIRSATATEAKVASWFSFGVRKKTEAQLDGLTSFGWYDDTFVLEDGMWRVHRRRVLRAGEP